MIRYLFFVAVLIVSLISCAFAYSENDISRLEFQKYGRCYEDDSLAERLSRLENDYLGMTQSGDIEKRVYNLLAVGNSNPNGFESYEDFQQEQTPEKKKGKFKTFWNNISSGLSDMGSMTGFIPPITTYGNYNSYSPYYNGLGHNGHWNSYNTYPNAYSNDPFHNNHIYHRGCIQPHHHFNPINNRIVHRITSNLYNNRYYNGVVYPNMYPYQNPYYPTQGYTNYSTRSTVKILND